MVALPREAKIVQRFQAAFTQPTYQRFVELLIGCIIRLHHIDGTADGQPCFVVDAVFDPRPLQQLGSL